jgi:hypothetical protein
VLNGKFIVIHPAAGTAVGCFGGTAHAADKGGVFSFTTARELARSLAGGLKGKDCAAL